MSNSPPQVLHTDAPRGKYKTVPDLTDKMPRCIPFIVVNECAERFSFYGMTAILTIFMTTYLRDSSGNLAVMPETQANQWYHYFNTAVYFTPLIGSLVADLFWGKYRTIFWVSLFYCVGHAALSAGQTQGYLLVGLILIALGAGGIKPCVSANVGDQFGPANQHLLPKVYSWFYFAINLGAFFSQYTIPEILDYFGGGTKDGKAVANPMGPKVAFAIPGILMGIAALVFWMGRKQYVHAPPAGWSKVKENFSGKNLRLLLKLAVLFVLVSPFYTLYYQNGSEWVLQAKKMDLSHDWNIFGWHYTGSFLAAQIQSVNSFLILVFTPIFAYFVYPFLSRIFKLTAQRKMIGGMFLMLVTYLPIVYIQKELDAGGKPSYWWQVLGYTLVTAAEVMVSIPILEFAYTHAPKKMKSLVMALYFAGSISLGNFLGNQVSSILQGDGLVKYFYTQTMDLSNPDKPVKQLLPNVNFYWLYMGYLVAGTILFMIVSRLIDLKSDHSDDIDVKSETLMPGGEPLAPSSEQ
jgi:proton-dependent oligopeptide transporter, POT family